MTTHTRIRALFQFRLLKLMPLVALCAVLPRPAVRRDNDTVERSLTASPPLY